MYAMIALKIGGFRVGTIDMAFMGYMFRRTFFRRIQWLVGWALTKRNLKS